MIAKIGRGSNLYGALIYNQNKVEKGNGSVLETNKMIETVDGRYTMRQLLRSFEPYLIANRNTEKPVLHISLNPDPKDQVRTEQLTQIASDYMNQMGYGEQPFIVFKHTDIERCHIHIVSVCVDEKGKKISDRYEKVRSMKVCRDLEKKYQLTPATNKKQSFLKNTFQPVDFRSGDIKSQMASVIRHLPNHYQFQTLGEYNALLSLFNISTEKVEVSMQTKAFKGLLYFPLNEKGERSGHPLKASLFGKSAGLAALEMYFVKCQKALKDHPGKQQLKAVLIDTLASSSDQKRFIKLLVAKGIDVVVRRNDAGRIYGITFIDHHSRTVWNGSRLSKELSANSFNEYWNSRLKPDIKESLDKKNSPLISANPDLFQDEPPRQFDFLSSDQNRDGLFEALGGLLPEVQGEDYEEHEFAKKMKKKHRGKRGLH